MQKKKTYAVFGLGRYGMAVAKELIENGREVIAVDLDSKIVTEAAAHLPVCKCADITDPEVIRKEITATVKICQKYGCPLDITLKDISTVGYRPENLMIWAKTASEVLDEYYGEE